MLLSDNGSIHPVGNLAAKQPDISLAVGRRLKKKKVVDLPGGRSWCQMNANVALSLLDVQRANYVSEHI